MTSWIKRHPISAVVGTILLLAVSGSSSSVTEGRVHISVDRYLREHFSSDDDQALRASTRVTDIYYCQSALRSSGSLKRLSKRQRQSARRPSRGLVNHDYVVVALTATKSDGQPVNLFISAEKEGGGQGGGDPGIYINALTDDQYRSLHANKLASWDGFSILVPLDVLTRKLREADDPHYNVLTNNCWYYAQAASKSLLLLLSEQPGVNHKQSGLGFSTKRVFIYAVPKSSAISATNCQDSRLPSRGFEQTNAVGTRIIFCGTSLR